SAGANAEGRGIRLGKLQSGPRCGPAMSFVIDILATLAWLYSEEITVAISEVLARFTERGAWGSVALETGGAECAGNECPARSSRRYVPRCRVGGLGCLTDPPR